MTSIQALRKYFDTPPLDLKELRVLDPDERSELDRLACEALGEEWTPPGGAKKE